MSLENAIWLAIAAGGLAIIYGLFSVRWILAQPAGNARMQEIAAAVQAGARAYLNRQYSTIALVGVVLFVVIGWIANGLAYLIVGIRNKYSPSRSFYLFFGILQLVLAAFVIAWPNATVTVLVRVIGIGLLIAAAFGLWAARQIRKGAAGQGNIVVIEQP